MNFRVSKELFEEVMKVEVVHCKGYSNLQQTVFNACKYIRSLEEL